MAVSTFRARAAKAAAVATQALPARDGVLAEPPPGSGLKAICGEAGPPLVGHTLSLTGDTLGLAKRLHARYGPVSWVGGFGRRMVIALGPDAIESVLGNRDGAWSNRDGWGFVIGPFFEGGVMLKDADEHRFHRRIMQQAFKRDRLIAYLHGLNAGITRGLDRWDDDPAFALYDRTKQLTLDLATEVFVGAQLGPEADGLNSAFMAAVHGGTAVVRHDVPGGNWHRGLAGRRRLADYFRAQLPAKRASDGDDLFSVLCRAEDEDGGRFSDDEVVEHMIFVLMAAHDTSTSTLAWMGYFLARHPEWQERLREESRALGRDVIGYDELDALPSMDRVFKETLRFYAPVGILFREASADTAVGEHFVPAGTLLALNLFASQRMEPWWRDPDVFDPDRFSPERREDQSHTFAWTPFGGNVHKCIGMHFGGMEVKAILHQLLLGHEWELTHDHEPPLAFATGPIPADGLPIRLRRRAA